MQLKNQLSTASRKLKITYWVSTGLLTLFILPGIFFMGSPEAVEGPRHLGIPDWLAMEIGIGHFIGGLLLILPFVAKRFKEWAYVGCGIKYLSAMIGHLVVDGWQLASFSPLIFFSILLISYNSYHQLTDK